MNPKETMEDKCFICSKELKDNVVKVGDKMRESLLKSSAMRADGNIILLRNTENLVIHSNCSKSYPTRKSIAAYLRKHPIQSRSTPKSLNSDFDFDRLCLICLEDASVEFIEKMRKRKKQTGRNQVSLVSDNSLVETLLSRIDSDCRLKYVLQSEPNFDLVAKNARYHRDCLRVFLKKPLINDSKRMRR